VLSQPSNGLPATPQDPAQTAPAQIAPTQAAPVQAAIDWQQRGSAEIQALDKISARTTTLTGKVGDTLHFGSLSITVRACVSRGADEPADSAAFLDITDSHPSAPSFHGWMLAAEPAASMLEHPVYDVRLTACR
jgi:hypothetical protein